MKNELKGRIVAAYGTVSNFAEKIGWSKRKAFYIVNGRQEPTGKDIEQMAEALDIVIPADLHAIFFA